MSYMLSNMSAGVMTVNIAVKETQHTTGAQTFPVRGTATTTIGGRGAAHGTAQLAAILFIKLDRENLLCYLQLNSNMQQSDTFSMHAVIQSHS